MRLVSLEVMEISGSSLFALTTVIAFVLWS